MGCVIRPARSCHASVSRDSSATECAAKNSGVTRARVVSDASALAPFSQNSNRLRWSSGSGHAQLGQSNPSF